MLYKVYYSIIQAVNQYMHHVNCIYIDSETKYFMILIMYKSAKQYITNSVSGSPYKFRAVTSAATSSARYYRNYFFGSAAAIQY